MSCIVVSGKDDAMIRQTLHFAEQDNFPPDEAPPVGNGVTRHNGQTKFVNPRLNVEVLHIRTHGDSSSMKYRIKQDSCN